MSRTLYGHYIATIKGDDYVLHKDYTELQNKYYKQKEVLDKILKLKRYTSLIEYDEEFVKVKDILKLLEEIEQC